MLFLQWCGNLYVHRRSCFWSAKREKSCDQKQLYKQWILRDHRKKGKCRLNRILPKTVPKRIWPAATDQEATFVVPHASLETFYEDDILPSFLKCSLDLHGISYAVHGSITSGFAVTSWCFLERKRKWERRSCKKMSIFIYTRYTQ
jgi:hypothetical protein